MLILLAATLFVHLTGCCPERTISRDAIAPSINAVTSEFDSLVTDAVAAGSMDPVEGQTWMGEAALLRSLVADDAEE